MRSVENFLGDEELLLFSLSWQFIILATFFLLYLPAFFSDELVSSSPYLIKWNEQKTQTAEETQRLQQTKWCKYKKVNMRTPVQMRIIGITLINCCYLKQVIRKMPIFLAESFTGCGHENANLQKARFKSRLIVGRHHCLFSSTINR